MGQYFITVNMDKKEYIHPHKFDDGLKLGEFGCSANGTMAALALLLRKSSESGGGDYSGKNKFVGRWAGDRIVIVGDYDDSKLYEEAEKSYKNISSNILLAVKELCGEERREIALRPDIIMTAGRSDESEDARKSPFRSAPPQHSESEDESKKLGCQNCRR